MVMTAPWFQAVLAFQFPTGFSQFLKALRAFLAQPLSIPYRILTGMGNV